MSHPITWLLTCPQLDSNQQYIVTVANLVNVVVSLTHT